ncbi:hypothetical protein FKW77_001543 [Venturia effusa]|uniref:Uncharacterized protein n=1 Tax=Venturia effusa TaxID=50376 RepID=A0A517KVU5_9PEZI|nr:hypothetical protein FKW77_001543 [Venturia effusa]
MSEVQLYALSPTVRDAKILNVVAALQDTWDEIDAYELGGRKRVQELDSAPSDEELLRSFAVAVEIYFKKLETELLIEFPETVVVAGMDNYFNDDDIELIDAENSTAFIFPVFQPLSAQNLDIYNGIVRGARETLIDLVNTRDEAGINQMREVLLETIVNGSIVSEWVDDFMYSQYLANGVDLD